MLRTNISMDTGKPDAAVPVENGRALPRAATQGDVTASPFPLEPTNEDARFNPLDRLGSEPVLLEADCDKLAAALVAEDSEPDCWTQSARLLMSAVMRRHWRDQADGFFE